MNDGYKRITLICGHYGAGKTTFSINYAIHIKNNISNNVYIADLDVVNPYFRSREYSNYLESKDIKVIGSYLFQSGADLPAVSADVYSLFARKDVVGIIDMGGNSVGSLSFATFRDNVDIDETDVFFILNANRKENSTVEYALGHLRNIEAVLGLKVTGIINNTHLMYDTNIDDIKRGEEIAHKLSIETDIPVKFTCLDKDFYLNNKNIDHTYDLFTIDYDIKSIGNSISF